ncbi:conserved hypothetical protein [Vibrio cholerae MO10]|uniref:Uncharacterized protein n=3 Tax=Vibrio cholerae TaxID=666 RepID=Q9KS48_VIBCH|nr:hypothetical protein VC_1412 [Vibrio cholerae O1 biovar El Tor str. N16961]ACP05683.1 conserved hypothetical protein [Vibrio cholerae M66-2]ACP09537.1 conserved hypothetical protein [Vibrio cholerae O395]EET22649.1 conserved hypothetical protein [Vibrio cholerae MO10]
MRQNPSKRWIPLLFIKRQRRNTHGITPLFSRAYECGED